MNKFKLPSPRIAKTIQRVKSFREIPNQDLNDAKVSRLSTLGGQISSISNNFEVLSGSCKPELLAESTLQCLRSETTDKDGDLEFSAFFDSKQSKRSAAKVLRTSTLEERTQKLKGTLECKRQEAISKLREIQDQFRIRKVEKESIIKRSASPSTSNPLN